MAQPAHLVQARLYHHRKQNRARQVLFAFDRDGYVASPHNFGSIAANASSVTGLTLPEGTSFGISLDANWSAGDIAIEDNANQQVFGDAGVADQIVRVDGFFPRSRTIQIFRATGAPAGAFALYIFDRDRPIQVGQATFSV